MLFLLMTKSLTKSSVALVSPRKLITYSRTSIGLSTSRRNEMNVGTVRGEGFKLFRHSIGFFISEELG